jgi:tetratricopeptide (TPR) repeat protein
MVFFPRTHIRVLLFFFIIGVYSIPSIWFIGFAIARDLFLTGVGGTNIATLAHLGGYGFGFTVAMTLLATKVVPREPFDLFSLGRQAKRRREFKAVAASGGSPWSHETPEKPRQKRDIRAERESEELARRRHAISSAARENDRETAMKLYLQLASERPEAVMGRAMQLDLAGWLFESGRHAEADEAYGRFLKRHPDDAEAHRVRLLSALIRARYLDESAGAEERLGKIERSRLSEQERSLFDALRDETGAAGAESGS